MFIEDYGWSLYMPILQRRHPIRDFDSFCVDDLTDFNRQGLVQFMGKSVFAVDSMGYSTHGEFTLDRIRFTPISFTAKIAWGRQTNEEFSVRPRKSRVRELISLHIKKYLIFKRAADDCTL